MRRASALVFLLLPFLLMSQNRKISDDEVMRVHRSALLIDTHNDVPWRMADGTFDIGKRSDSWHTDLPRLRQGGFGAVFFSAYVGKEYVQGHRSAKRARQLIEVIHQQIIAKYPQDFVAALSAKDIESAHAKGKIAALIGLEGGHAIEDDLGILREFYNSGVRYMTLTHTNTNDWADSAGDIGDSKIQHHNGLTKFGTDVIREMNRLGMMVDVSHVADKTFWDALAVSRAPVFASHSSCRALADAGRNLTDEMIVALAKKGGVVQINFNCGFLSQHFRDVQDVEEPKLEARFQKERNGRDLREDQQDLLYHDLRREMHLTRAKLSDVVDHIDHVRKIAGIDAVGIGTDFNGITCSPEGLDDVSQMPNLTRALLERGYSAADIRKIYGGNLLRVMRAVEAAAGK